MKTALRVSLPVLFSILAFGASAPLASAASFYVDPIGTDDATSFGTTTSSGAFRTIQYAIDNASGSDTINVAAGTYTEQILINKPLTLTGAGANATTIQAPDPTTMTFSDQSAYLAGSASTRGRNKAIVSITAPNVTFQNFRVTPNNQLLASVSSPYTGVGILVDHVGGATPVALTGITISNNLINGENPLDVISAIKIIGEATATVSGNTIHVDGSGFGIHILGLDKILPTGTYHPNVDVTNNTIYAGTTARPISGSSWNGLFYGIYYFFGANGTASGNTVYGAYGWGLNTWDAGDVSFTNNTVDTDGSPSRTDRGHGSQLIGSSNRVSHLTFSHNTITNKFYASIISQNLPAIWTAQYNTISNTDDGFIFDRITSGTATITTNSFGVTGKAIVMGGTAGTSSGTAYGNWSGASSITVDATNNWWGTVSSTGVAAKIVGSVSYIPWYTNAGMTTNSAAKLMTSFNIASPSVTGAIDTIAHTVSLMVPSGTNVTTLVPTIATSTGATVSPASGSVQDFTTPVTYTVTSADGSASQSYVVTVSTAAADQTVPDVSGAATIDATTPEVVITNPTQAVDVTISSGTSNPTIDVSAFITGGTGTLPEITVTSVDAGNATVVIPASTVVTSADNTWNGVIAAPTITTVSLPETVGEVKSLSTAIEVGFSGAKLSFDNAVRLLLPGQAGRRAGYVRTGIAFTEITNVCSVDDQATMNTALATDGDCRMDASNGLDLIIWTKHFTSFATYTQQTANPPSNSSGGSGGSISPIFVPILTPTITTTTTTTTSNQGQVLGAAAYNFTKALTVGVRSDEVTELQKALIAEGVLKIDAPTGYFGELTKAAVIAFQKARGIANTGFVGPLTRAELNKGSVVSAAATGKTNLTSSQADAIISLVESFGADASVVAKIRASLGR